MKNRGKWSIGFSFAVNGLVEAWRRERNFRVHIIVAILVCIASFYFGLTNLEWAVILMMIVMVLVTELVNSIIERLIDYLKPDWHNEAKVIKDMSAAVVLLTAMISIIVGLLIFFPKIF